MTAFARAITTACSPRSRSRRRRSAHGRRHHEARVVGAGVGEVPDPQLAGVVAVDHDVVAARGDDVMIYGDYTGELRIGDFTDARADDSGFVMATTVR